MFVTYGHFVLLENIEMHVDIREYVCDHIGLMYSGYGKSVYI